MVGAALALFEATLVCWCRSGPFDPALALTVLLWLGCSQSGPGWSRSGPGWSRSGPGWSRSGPLVRSDPSYPALALMIQLWPGWSSLALVEATLVSWCRSGP
jgi:hypothetical protein